MVYEVQEKFSCYAWGGIGLNKSRLRERVSKAKVGMAKHCKIKGD